MSRDEIIAMAREAGFVVHEPAPATIWGGRECSAELVRYDALVAAKEREACAQVCESEWSNVAERMYGRECAAFIRARSKT